jgi:hypothetical protein
MFTQEFGEHYFDYLIYDPDKGRIVIDMTSNKNLKILNRMARELNNSVKKILGL